MSFCAFLDAAGNLQKSDWWLLEIFKLQKEWTVSALIALSVKRSGQRKRGNRATAAGNVHRLHLFYSSAFFSNFFTVSPPLPLYLDTPLVDNENISCYVKSVNTVSFVTPLLPFLISLCIFSKSPCLSWFICYLLSSSSSSLFNHFSPLSLFSLLQLSLHSAVFTFRCMLLISCHYLFYKQQNIYKNVFLDSRFEGIWEMLHLLFAFFLFVSSM